MTRKTLIAMVLVCFVGGMFIAGCSSNKPEDVMKDVKELIADGDYEGAEERLAEMDTSEINAAVKTQVEALRATIKTGKAGKKIKEALGG